jgi:hypothetical protein
MSTAPAEVDHSDRRAPIHGDRVVIHPVVNAILHEEFPDFLQQLDRDPDVRPGWVFCGDPNRSLGRCIGHCVSLPFVTTFRSYSTALVLPRMRRFIYLTSPPA